MTPESQTNTPLDILSAQQPLSVLVPMFNALSPDDKEQVFNYVSDVFSRPFSNARTHKAQLARQLYVHVDNALHPEWADPAGFATKRMVQAWLALQGCNVEGVL